MKSGFKVYILFIIIAIPIIYLFNNYYDTKFNNTRVITERINKEDEAIKDMLRQQGIKDDKLNNKTQTESGFDILGDALPVKDFRTLADAEKEFGMYFGLHNKLESLKGYELVKMLLVNNEFLYGIYDNKDGSKSLNIKLSVKRDVNYLIKPYKDYAYKDIMNIYGIDVNISGDTDNIIHLAYFSVPNGKSYSIHTLSGLSKEDMKKLLEELIYNLMSMSDWK